MKKSMTKSLLCLVLAVLLAAAALGLTGCTPNTPATPPETAAPVVTTAAPVESAAPVVTTEDAGTVSYTFSYTDADGNSKSFDLTTSYATVGEALLVEGLIAGEDGQYGLYVTTVDGITLDWNVDGKYWAFYIDGEYAMTGVDSTPITEGAVYEFKAE